MNIALVHMRHAHTGGTERYLNLLAMEMAENGHQVYIICRSHEELTHSNIHFVCLKSFALGKSQRMWRFAKDVERHVQVAEYDLVYGLGKTWTHDVIRIGGGSHKRFLERMPGCRLRRKDRVSMELEAKAFQPGNYQLVIANSHMCAKEISEDFDISAEKLRVIHNSVDLNRFQPDLLQAKAADLRLNFAIEPDAILYLFLGTGYERKGLIPLLEAFSKANLSDKSKLLVVGYESDQERYQELARKNGIEGQVIFAGGRRDAEVCYAAADVYVLPSRYDPFANTTLEALAAGLPVITTAANGGSEVLNESVGTILSDAENVDTLATALELWQNHELRSKARPAAQKCAEEFDHQGIMAETRILLEKIAEEKVLDNC